ncbi:Uncharacterised protein [Klebsiella pneumoniae]|nr:Uncharacterised protein [Klebsiella pneumoniae]
MYTLNVTLLITKFYRSETCSRKVKSQIPQQQSHSTSKKPRFRPNRKRWARWLLKFSATGETLIANRFVQNCSAASKRPMGRKRKSITTCCLVCSSNGKDMNRSNADRLIDQLIGEAVLCLLKERGPVTTEGLLQRLRVMKEHEKDPQRRETLAMVIAEIGSNSIAFTRRRTAQGRSKREGSLNDNRDNVVPLFGSGKPSDPKKIH